MLATLQPLFLSIYLCLIASLFIASIYSIIIVCLTRWSPLTSSKHARMISDGATTLRPGDFCATGALTTINNKLHYTISSPLYFLHRSLQDTPERLEWPERHKTAENTLRDTQNSQAAAGSRPPSPTLSHGTLSPRPEHTDTCVRASDGASS